MDGTSWRTACAATNPHAGFCRNRFIPLLQKSIAVLRRATFPFDRPPSLSRSRRAFILFAVRGCPAGGRSSSIFPSLLTHLSNATHPKGMFPA
jgi:hypothetical protein